MNCPICGAPLGATDNECKNCGTRRAEMGAAYNNQQNSYGYGGNQGGAPNQGSLDSGDLSDFQVISDGEVPF